jgi:hypothetical protein
VHLIKVEDQWCEGKSGLLKKIIISRKKSNKENDALFQNFKVGVRIDKR